MTHADSAGDRGSIAVVVAAGSLVLALAAAACADLGIMVIARARAQAAADAAALAAASALAPVLAAGDTPLGRAAEMARANGASLVGCACASGDTEALVRVEIVVRTLIVRRWNGEPVRASARATLDPDVYSYRG